MKIYLAASFQAQRRIRPLRDKLFSMGHTVISSWLEENMVPAGMSQEIFDRQLAVKDLQEVKCADIIIVDTMEPSTTGGRYAELGFSLAQPMLKYHVGPINSIFERLVDVHFDTWDECFEYFEDYHPVEDYVATGMEDKQFTSATEDSNGPYGIYIKENVNGTAGSWYQESPEPGRDGPLLFSTWKEAEKFRATDENVLSWSAKGTVYEIRPYREEA